MKKVIGILTGGGDCPGLNQAIRGCTLKAIDFGWEVLGFQDGWKGIIKGACQKLDGESVVGLMNRGGTMLGTSRTNPYKTEKGVEGILETFKKLGLGGLIAMGGDDTLGVAEKLHKEHGLPVVGVPKTMDNDLASTDYTFGFDTAVTLAVNALEILRDTGRSHRRIMVLEVMGRHAGWVALYTAIAAESDWILIPEEEADIDAMCAHLKQVYDRRKVATVVVSEGATLSGMKIGDENLDQFGHMLLKQRGVAEYIAGHIEKKLNIETRFAVIGHMQRGGPPTVFDRILGLRAGVHATELINERKFGQMVSLKGKDIVSVPLSEVSGRNSLVDRAWINFAHSLFQ